MATVAGQLAAIGGDIFANDELHRLQAYQEARALVTRLEKPWEKIWRMISEEPTLMIATKTASDLQVFSHLTQTPQSSAELAGAVSADPALLSRLLRVLVVHGMVAEVDENAFAETEVSKALGQSTAIDQYYDMGMHQTARMPRYLQETGYRNPADPVRTPWKWIMETDLSFWDWLKSNPKIHANLNSLLTTAVRREQPAWPSYFEDLARDHDPASAFVVDVGGNKGRDLAYIAERVHGVAPGAKLFLQDLPSVIAEAKSEDLPSQVELMPHSFFEEQPVKHARVYFMHSILHDWPDSSAIEILCRLKDAMKPGYSKIVLLEGIFPERARDVEPRMAALDINMMCRFSAQERTEKQWRTVLELSQLRWVRAVDIPGVPHKLIEIEV